MMDTLFPIAAFILGSLFTLVFERWRRRKEIIATSTKEIARLAKDWYNQVHDLLAQREAEHLDAWMSKLGFYLSNRVILPEFLMHLEVLKSNPNSGGLVEKSEQFLSLLTRVTPQKTLKCYYLNGPDGPDIESHPRRFAEGVEKIQGCNNFLTDFQEFITKDVRILESLDSAVQRIARQAGQLLK